MGKGYEDLQVWQSSMNLVERIYDVVREFPTSESFILSRQLLRAAISVPSNIAEGKARQSDRECAHHLRIAAGSLAEVETQLLLAARLGYLEPSDMESIIEECRETGRMLNGLISFMKGTRKT